MRLPRGMSWRIVGIVVGCTAGASPSLACTTEDFKCTLQADAMPTDRPWTEPARASYSFVDGGEDSFLVDISGRANFDLGTGSPIFGLLELTWHRNNQQDKRQNNLAAAAGLHFEFDNTPATGPIQDRAGLYSIFIDLKGSWNRRGVYADATTPACIADPQAITCNTQVVESVRGTLDVSPHFAIFESDQRFQPADAEGNSGGDYEGPPIAYSFGVVGTVFTDEVTSNSVDPATGLAITGNVTGVRGTAGLLLSPRLTDYRLNLRLNAQAIQTLSRSAARESTFDDFSHLITASLDFDLGPQSVIAGSRQFRPSIGITWTDGADPLKGRVDQSTITVGLRLAYN